jgi:hypothetical protein
VCHRILDGDDLLGSQRFFIEALLATSEYETFFMLMRGEMHKYKDRYSGGESKK